MTEALKTLSVRRSQRQLAKHVPDLLLRGLIFLLLTHKQAPWVEALGEGEQGADEAEVAPKLFLVYSILKKWKKGKKGTKNRQPKREKLQRNGWTLSRIQKFQ
jgi:hypothetical protein